MKVDHALLASLLLSNAAASAIDTSSIPDRHVVRVESDDSEAHAARDFEELWKRRGGGGGGGRGGGSSGGGKGSGSGSGTSGGGSRGGNSGGSSSGRGTNTRTTSNNGGYSQSGTGPQPSYGKSYAGGAPVPYRAGGKSPGSRSIAPFALGAGAIGLTSFFLIGAYLYPLNSHRFYNSTSRKNEDRNVTCGCEPYSVCACEEIEDQDYWDKLIGDGDYSKLNKSVVTVSDVNGTQTILINGTLPNGTTVPSDNPDDYAQYIENAAAVLRVVGLWPAAAAVAAAVLMA